MRAVEQRDRADRRYQEARDLADFFMEDVHDAIVELPGTMSTREMVVQRALTYLNRLQQESADDISVKLDIARGRRRVGQIMGGTRGPSRRRTRNASCGARR